MKRFVPVLEVYTRRVRERGDFYLPNAPRDRQEFPAESDKANFFVHPISRLELKPGQLLMTSLRSHDQFNTTIYGQDDRYRGIHGGRFVDFLNRYDASQHGLIERQ